MKLTQIRLGDYIKRVNVKNADGVLGLDKYISVSDDKRLKPTKKPKVITGTNPKKYKIARRGQFVFNVMVDFGKGLSGGRLYEESALVSPEYEVFEVDSDQLDPEYLLLLLSTVQFDKYVDNFAKGTAYRRFRWHMIAETPFEIPELSDQQKVVSTFQKLNRLIDLKLETIKSLHEIGNNIFRNQFCTVDKDSFLKLKIVGEQVRLGEFVKIKLGGAVTRNLHKFTLVPTRSVTQPYPAFSSSVFQDFIYGFVDCYDQLNTIVTVDKFAGTVRIRYQKSLAVNEVNVIDCDLKKCLPEYLFFCLKNTHINKTGTTAREMVTARTLLKHKLYLPTLEVQQKFAEQVKPLLKLAEQCAYDLYELRQLRKAWLTDFRPELLAKAAV